MDDVFREHPLERRCVFGYVLSLQNGHVQTPSQDRGRGVTHEVGRKLAAPGGSPGKPSGGGCVTVAETSDTQLDVFG